MIWTKAAHQSRKFQNFDCSHEMSLNLHFDRLLLLKVYKISYDIKERCKIWRKADFLFQRVWWIYCHFWWILTRALKILKNFHFDWFLLCNVYHFWPKKVQWSYLSWHWRMMHNLKKNWPVVWKMTWGIWRIFNRALESVKIWTLMRLSCLKYKMH